MSGKTLLVLAFVAFLVFGLLKVFRKDTSDPSAVLNRYLAHWESNNTTGMYPLLSQRAKDELKKEKVDNVADYYAYFVEHRADLTSYLVASQQVNDANGRFWVKLKVLDYVGRELTEETTFTMVREVDGWRVDGWQRGPQYHLP